MLRHFFLRVNEKKGGEKFFITEYKRFYDSRDSEVVNFYKIEFETEWNTRFTRRTLDFY